MIILETWKDIEGFEGIYQVSDQGRVKSLERYSPQKHLIKERILKFSVSQGGYLDVSLYKDGKRYHKKPHKLVAEAFIPNPNNLPEVDHIDTNKFNNTVENLRWVTHQENHMNPLTRKLKSEINTGKKLSEEQCEKMRKKINVYKDGVLLHTFKSYVDLDKNSKSIFGVTLWNVYVRQVIIGKRKEYHGYTFSET